MHKSWLLTSPTKGASYSCNKGMYKDMATLLVFLISRAGNEDSFLQLKYVQVTHQHTINIHRNHDNINAVDLPTLERICNVSRSHARHFPLISHTAIICITCNVNNMSSMSTILSCPVGKQLCSIAVVCLEAC